MTARILIVEDNLSLIESIALDLSLRGFDVAKALDGQLALDYLGQAHELPDIIVSDIAMPNMDGYALLDEVQQQPDWAEIPFIFLSARDTTEDIRVGKQLGADDYIVKPFNVDDLVIAIENKLHRAAIWRRGTMRRIDQVRDELMAYITHERHHELRSISAFYPNAEALLADLEAMPDEFSQRALDAIRHKAYYTNRLLNQIVFLTQSDGGHLRDYFNQNAVLCELQPLIGEAVRQIEQETHDESRHFQLRLAPEPLYIAGVPDLLLMLFAEVVRNAVLFSPANSIIIVELASDSHAVRLRVADQGPGIAEDLLSRVWERFSQLQLTGKAYQGAGLGLPVSQEIMRLHGGHIHIGGRPGLTITTMRFTPTTQLPDQGQA